MKAIKRIPNILRVAAQRARKLVQRGRKQKA